MASLSALEEKNDIVPENPKGNYRSKEQRKQDSQRRNRIKELEKLIEDTEQNIGIIEEELTKEEVFSDYVLMNEKCEELEKLKSKLEEYYEEWTVLSEENEG